MSNRLWTKWLWVRVQLQSLIYFFHYLYDLGLDLSLNSAIFSNRLLWSLSAWFIVMLLVKSSNFLFVSYFKSFLLSFFPHFLISSISFLFYWIITFFGKSTSIDCSSWSFGFKAFKTLTCFIPWYSIAFICFPNPLSREE